MVEKSNRPKRLVSIGSVALAALMLAAAAPAVVGQGGTIGKEGKDACAWSLTSIDSPIDTPVGGRGTAMGTSILTLDCPNHIEVGEAQYGYKDCNSPLGICDSPLPDIVVTDLGRTDEPKMKDPAGGGYAASCGWSRSWIVSAPSESTYVFWFRVHTLKDADCDKKADDWNHEQFEQVVFRDEPSNPPTVWRQTNAIPPNVVPYGDGSLDGNPCYWHNTYYDGRLAFSKPPVGGGLKDPRAPGYVPSPDGEVNECDWQNYEFQWRQWN